MKNPAEEALSLPLADNMPGSLYFLHNLLTESRESQARIEAVNDELAARLAEFAALNANLQAQNADLNAFAHTVAHDLKNPVSQVMAFADFLGSYFHTLSAQQLKDGLHAIFRASAKMNSIIEELLLLSQISKAEVETEPLYMPAIVEEALGRVEQLTVELRGQIHVPDMRDWPVGIGQRAWIEEVWVNYLSNALKYGGRPPVVEFEATLESGDRVRFSVRDNGSGLTPEEQHRLFVPFERVGQVRATGYGLGLSIVQRIIEKLHGQVAVESRPGVGSTFSFTLPAAHLE